MYLAQDLTKTDFSKWHGLGLGKGQIFHVPIPGLDQKKKKKKFSKWHGLGLGKGKIFHVPSPGLDQNRNFPSGMA